MNTETIVAIATALTESGIGIIRISGSDSLSIADSIFRNKKGNKCALSFDANTIHYGYIVEFDSDKSFNDSIIDEVMISVFKAPHSYTAEDTVEINCHGGVFVMKKILQNCVLAGARLAEPGEFTKRAFLNGRIDLSRAEAVMDIISSSNEYSHKASLNQLHGLLFNKIKTLRDELIYEIAFIESALDDPEHISLDGYPSKLSLKINSLISDIESMLSNAESGRIIKEGISTVIVGKPNAGKSSLLNLLVGEERAIVTDIAGTTRDILEEHISLDGIGLNIIDTAGIRDTSDVVEKIGVDRAKKYACDADLIVYVVDSTKQLDQSDYDILELCRDKKVIVLLNKSDLSGVINEEVLEKEIRKYLCDNSFSIIKTSTKENTGLEDFKQVIRNMFFEGKVSYDSESVIINIRHKNLLLEALNSLKLVIRSINDDMPEDFYSIDLMNAYSELGKIIGQEVEDDLVEEIFSKFCMGK